MTGDSRYELPVDTGTSVRRMTIALAVFFGVFLLLVIAGIMYADKLAKRIPFSLEQQFVRPYETAIRKWYPHEPEPVIEDYLNNMIQDGVFYRLLDRQALFLP